MSTSSGLWIWIVWTIWILDVQIDNVRIRNGADPGGAHDH
jgi:hypothetical protein